MAPGRALGYAFVVASHPRKLHVQVTRDRMIRLPSEIPEGPAELIVIPSAEPAARGAAFGRYDASGVSVPDDFDAPLPDDVLALFEGGTANAR